MGKLHRYFISLISAVILSRILCLRASGAPPLQNGETPSWWITTGSTSVLSGTNAEASFTVEPCWTIFRRPRPQWLPAQALPPSQTCLLLKPKTGSGLRSSRGNSPAVIRSNDRRRRPSSRATHSSYPFQAAAETCVLRGCHAPPTLVGFALLSLGEVTCSQAKPSTSRHS